MSDENTELTEQPAAEPPDPVTASRHDLESAFRAFRKRATAAAYNDLMVEARRYQTAQLEARRQELESQYT